MNQLVDIAVTELLISRLCHEIVGPVGAINNGVELIEEMGEEMAADAMQLIGGSAKQAAARLQFFRVAYGRSGRMESRAAELRTLATNALHGGRIRFAWPMGAIAPDIPEGAAGLILCMIDLATHALPRGGAVTVEIGRAISVIAEGQGAAMPADLAAAMHADTPVAALTARTIHGHWAALSAKGIGRVLKAQPDGADRLRLTA